MYTQMKLPSGLFEAQRAIELKTAEGWEPEGIEHRPRYEDKEPETWMHFRRAA